MLYCKRYMGKVVKLEETFSLLLSLLSYNTFNVNISENLCLMRSLRRVTLLSRDAWTKAFLHSYILCSTRERSLLPSGVIESNNKVTAVIQSLPSTRGFCVPLMLARFALT